jgi:hypothetical protein
MISDEQLQEWANGSDSIKDMARELIAARKLANTVDGNAEDPVTVQRLFDALAELRRVQKGEGK